MWDRHDVSCCLSSRSKAEGQHCVFDPMSLTISQIPTAANRLVQSSGFHINSSIRTVTFMISCELRLAKYPWEMMMRIISEASFLFRNLCGKSSFSIGIPLSNYNRTLDGLLRNVTVEVWRAKKSHVQAYSQLMEKSVLNQRFTKEKLKGRGIMGCKGHDQVFLTSAASLSFLPQTPLVNYQQQTYKVL